MAGNATKVWDGTQWQDLAYVATGPQGPAGPGVAGGGATGQALVKSSATNYATQWAAPAPGGAAGGALSGTYPNPAVKGYACTITGSVPIPAQGAGALAKMAINTVVLDTAGWWNTSLARYVPQLAGRYLATAGYSGTVAGPGGTGLVDFAVYKNGARVAGTGQMREQAPAASWGGEYVVTGQFVMNGTTDYLEMFGGTGAALAGNERLDIAYIGPV